MINQDALTARVLHIDSRMRSAGTAEDMEFQLATPIHLPPEATLWVTGVNLPVWPNVSSLNDRLYLIEEVLAPAPFDPKVVGANQVWTRVDSSGATIDTRQWLQSNINARIYYEIDSAGNMMADIEFMEWSHGMHVVKFTVTQPGGALVGHFEFNRVSGAFYSTDVTWSYAPPFDFFT